MKEEKIKDLNSVEPIASESAVEPTTLESTIEPTTSESVIEPITSEPNIEPIMEPTALESAVEPTASESMVFEPMDHETVTMSHILACKMHHYLDQVGSGRVKEETEELKERIESLTRRCEMLKNDFKAYKERIKEDATRKENKIKRESIRELLPVIDALDRAIKNLSEDDKENTRLIYNQLLQILNLTPIMPSHGEKFDDRIVTAIKRTHNKLPDNAVVSVVRKGYHLNGDVLRPAEVIVSNGVDIPVMKEKRFSTLNFIKFHVLNLKRLRKTTLERV